MSGGGKLGEVERIDALRWSRGSRVTAGDRRKIWLACERFWARRGIYGNVWKALKRVEEVKSRGR